MQSFLSRFLIGYVDALDSSLRGFVSLLEWVFPGRVKSVRFGPFTFDLRGKTERSYDVVMGKLANARSSFAEAAQSIDDLKTEYEAENNRLSKLMNNIESKRDEYSRAVSDLGTAKELLAKDADSLKAVLGINDRRSKIVGFISGVLASGFVAAAFEWGDDLYRFVSLLWT